ncbi:MAG: Asp23/Gls24 family envelope stress response protein [Chloroflexi bacterium]|nr:Asp23/Gls24 family envelope stress response protein [Chloroflexota bacterium]MQC26013.1 Asp23/Gls24 family envelope stress response protein [Chloroflexota bacterium]
MSAITNAHGSIMVAPRAIATIAHRAAIETYGVVGLASKNLLNGISHFIVKDPTHGTEINYDEGRISIDLYVIVEYGVNIKSVASNVAQSVRFNVEKALGVAIEAVNVHVRGMHISNGEESR